MKKFVGMVVCLVPLAAFAQETYTNEDLRKFSVPGAYTNADLKKLPPLNVVTGPAAAPAPIAPEARLAEPYQVRFDLLNEQRVIYRADLEARKKLIEEADSYFDKGTDGKVWPGARSKQKITIQYLETQIAIVDARIEKLLDEVRRAGVVIDRRGS